MSTARNTGDGTARVRSNLAPPLLLAAAMATWALFGPDLLPVPLPPLRAGVLDRVGPGLLLLARDEGLLDARLVRIREVATADDARSGIRDGTFDAATLPLEDALTVVESGNDLAVLAVLDKQRHEASNGPSESSPSWDVLVVRRALLASRRDDLRELTRGWFAAVHALEADRERSLAQLAASLGQNAEALGSALETVTLFSFEEQQALLLASPPGLLEAAEAVSARMVGERHLHNDDCARRLLGIAGSAADGHATAGAVR